ncbi:YkgJ family cysteine cluster protein [Psychrobacter sp. CMS30]|uniref:YkgJ family cysteine cluster protein n=1 Tax=Psychrobacter sp. CMS30 TaxID=2774126 RepID=UPI0035AD7829
MSFPCNQCGWCCQNLDKSELYKSLDEGNGVCKFFDLKQNSCIIYDDRPKICNIEAMYHSAFTSMEYDDYINLNIKACKTVQRANQLPIIQI